MWSKRFGGTSDDAASALAVDARGNVYFTGYFRATIDFGGGPLTVPFTTDLDVYITKLDAAGNYVWAKNFTNDGNERGYGIAVDGSGNVAITGYFSNTVNFGGTSLTSVNGDDGPLRRALHQRRRTLVVEALRRLRTATRAATPSRSIRPATCSSPATW